MSITDSKWQIQKKIRCMKRYRLASTQQQNRLHPSNRQKRLRRISEIPSSLSGSHQEFLLDYLRRRPFGQEGELVVPYFLIVLYWLIFKTQGETQ